MHPQSSQMQVNWIKGNSKQCLASLFCATTYIQRLKKADNKSITGASFKHFGVSPPDRVSVELENLLRGLPADCYTLLQLCKSKGRKRQSEIQFTSEASMTALKGSSVFFSPFELRREKTISKWLRFQRVIFHRSIFSNASFCLTRFPF